jgi:broad specificity phosphatase PhoE
VSTFYLVRHGQVSPFAADYDVLSEPGHEQACRLGAHLAESRTRLDAVYTGPCRRHSNTVDSFVAQARRREVETPDPVEPIGRINPVGR